MSTPVRLAALALVAAGCLLLGCAAVAFLDHALASIVIAPNAGGGR